MRGRPLIEYTIRAAQESRIVDQILLSTDDDEIAEVGLRMGLDVRYRRPAELAADATPMIDSLEHGVRWIERERGTVPDEILLLQPTSPLRTARDIDSATALFRESGASSLVSVHAMGEHPSECIVKNGQRWSYLVEPPEGASRRQDYADSFYFINGAIYLARSEMLLSQRRFIQPGVSETYVMPRERGVDIDSYRDLRIAEAMLDSCKTGNAAGGS